jgi:hypothetical protein
MGCQAEEESIAEHIDDDDNAAGRRLEHAQQIMDRSARL